MRKKFRSASALFYTLLFGFSFFVTSVDIPREMFTPNVQGRQGGRDFSSNLENKTSGGVEESLPHKETLESVLSSSAVVRTRQRNEMENCPLRREILAHIHKPDTYEWIVNDTTFALLDNDLQQLIFCTKPFDRVILRLNEPILLNSTLKIFHELELIGESNTIDGGEEDESSFASFTCPESGPALEVNTNNFVAKGLKFENCTDSQGKAAVVIEANSKAIFNMTAFKDNLDRAVYIAKAANVTFTRSRFKGNQASGNGGAMYAENNSNIQIFSSTFAGNKASIGGAICVEDYSTLKIHKSWLSSNNALNFGGGIYANTNNTLTCIESTFSYNSAKYGGGVYCRKNNSLHVKSSNFSNNKVLGGGGLYFSMNNSVTMRGAIFSNNIAQDIGGGIRAYEKNTLDLSGSTFSNNSAQNGGGLHVALSNSLKMNHTKFSNNSAQENGGGLYLDTNNSLTFKASTISGSNALRFAGIGGARGGIYANTNNTLTCIESTFSYNSAKYGGGIYCRKNNSLHVKSSNFSNNKVLGGGGLYCYSNNKITMRGAIFSNNIAQDIGGGIRAYKENTLDLSGSTFSNNSAQNGGGLHVALGNSLTMNRTEFSSNVAVNGGAIFAQLRSIIGVSSSTFNAKKADYGGCISMGRSNLTILHSFLEGNKAREKGGAIFSEDESILNLTFTNFTRNFAKEGGGAVYTTSVSSTLKGCNFIENNASFGGACAFDGYCLVQVEKLRFEKNHAYLESGGAIDINSNSTLFASNVTIAGNAEACITNCKPLVALVVLTIVVYEENEAKKNSGGIFVRNGSFLNATLLFAISNSASDRAGGVGIFSSSAFLCYSCVFKRNIALDGAGLYIRSMKKRWSTDAQLQDCRFVKNHANCSGGGFVFEGIQDHRHNCFREGEFCGRIVLLSTSFVNNYAAILGSAFLSTNGKDVLVMCNYTGGRQKHFLEKHDLDALLAHTKPKRLCKSWKGNHLATSSNGVVGTFGKKLSLSLNDTNSSSEVRLSGNETAGFVLENMLSGGRLPLIWIFVVDEFGNKRAPSMPRTFSIKIKALDKLFQGVVSVTMTSGIGNFSDIPIVTSPGCYILNINPNITTIRSVMMKVYVRICFINEAHAEGDWSCRACGDNSYNFDPIRNYQCLRCPEDATCQGRYIVPKDGYWHKGPCHSNITRCIISEACTYDNRTKNLFEFDANFTNCELNNASLIEYEQKLCNKGYKGPLCGSCATGFGLSGNLECLKCGFVLLSVLRLLGIILYLLVGTILTIKGTLSIGSRRLYRQDAMAPLVGGASSLLMDERTSSQVEVESREEGSTLIEVAVQERTSSQVEEASQGGDDATQVATNEEQAVFRRMSSQLNGAFAKAQVNLVESWKILINFFQVTSSAAMMNVKWTKEILKFFKTLSLLGAATISSVSRPISCIVASSSTYASVVWRFIFNILVPMIVIAILSIFWFSRSLRRHKSEKFYLLRRFALVVITVIYITYFDITKEVVSVFNCVKVRDGENYNSPSATKYWIVDTSIECYKGTHVVLVVISVVVFTIVSICFPLACSWALSKTRDEVQLSNSRAHETLGLLCGPFKKKFVFWECVTMIKKAMLSIIIVFSYLLGNQAQGLLLSLVLMFFLTLHTTCYPFTQEFNSLNYYESGSLLISCATYTIVQFFNDDTLSETSRSLVSISLLILNGGFVTFMVFLIARYLIQLARAVLLSKNANISDGIRWYSILIVYLKNRVSNGTGS